MNQALARHWPEYLMEAAGLGFFMVSACIFGTLLEHPGSPVRNAIDDPLVRRALMGGIMGLTAIAIIYSPWGKQSGAHLNPAVTLAFLRLGKIAAADAAFYILAQFAGGIAGVALVAGAAGRWLADPAVNYVVTVPGAGGAALAFLAEAAISCGLMLAVLGFSNRKTIARYAGVVAGLLVAIYITIEAPISGMSMNPARTFGSAAVADYWTALWIYFTAPPLGMLVAAEWRARRHGLATVLCAKLHHDNHKRCIFHCRWGEASAPRRVQAAHLPRQLAE
jgi:aquaporin Z